MRVATRSTLASLRTRLLTGVALAASLLVTACGGGGDSSGSFYVSAVVAGQNMGNYGPGVQTLYIHAGQSLELDAAEPVYWTLYVGNTAITSTGTSVSYANVNITLTALTSSRIAVDTYPLAPLGGAVPITLVATSTIDSAQVATIDVLITN